MNVSELYRLDVFLPKLKSDLEIYANDRKIIFYEIRNNINLNLNCTATLLKKNGYVVYAQFAGHSECFKLAYVAEIAVISLTPMSVCGIVILKLMDRFRCSFFLTVVLKHVSS